MIVTRLVLLGVFVSLGACGRQFSASGAVAGEAGSTASGGSAGAAQGGATSGGTAGSHPAGAGSGGSPNVAGSGGSAGVAGTSGRGGSAGTAGISGSGGLGGAAPIPSDGLALWLTSDRGVVASGGLVQQWLDQSGHHMDTIQTGLNFQPKLVTNGGFGTPSTLEFDGVDDYLNLPPGFGDFSRGLSMFTVVKPTSADCASIVELSNGSEVQDISIGLYQQVWQYEAFTNFIPGGMVSSAPTLLAAVHRPNESVDLRVNSMIVAQSSFALPEAVVRTQAFVGKTLYLGCNTFQGNLAEILVYNRAVTDLELLQIEGYLQTHWGCCK